MRSRAEIHWISAQTEYCRGRKSAAGSHRTRRSSDSQISFGRKNFPIKDGTARRTYARAIRSWRRIDRLARSVKDLQDIVDDLRAKGVALRATGQPIDTSSPAGKAFLDMLGVFAEFETSLRRERQMEGIAKAKAQGIYQGRKPDLPREAIQKARAEGMTPMAIAAQFGVARSSVYRALGEAEVKRRRSRARGTPALPSVLYSSPGGCVAT